MTVTAPADPPADSPAGRRGHAAPRRPNRLLSAVVGLALIVAAVAAQELVLTPNEELGSITYTGGLREGVSAGRYSARVDSVTVARSIEVPGLGGGRRGLPTDHVFLIVSAAATVPVEPLHLTATLLSADNRRYAVSDRVDSSYTLTNTWIQPGWWAPGYFVFEVPPAVLPGSRVAVTLESGFISEGYPPEVEIDLGLDQAAADALVAKAQDSFPLGRKS